MFLQVSAEVFHMERDDYKNDESILIGTSTGLQTTDGQTSTNLVSHKVHGFTQVNNTHVVVVDRDRHCLYVLHRRNNNIQPLAGTCGSGGNKNGGVGDSFTHGVWK